MSVACLDVLRKINYGKNKVVISIQDWTHYEKDEGALH
jgi:hypothetical protein